MEGKSADFPFIIFFPQKFTTTSSEGFINLLKEQEGLRHVCFTSVWAEVVEVETSPLLQCVWLTEVGFQVNDLIPLNLSHFGL